MNNINLKTIYGNFEITEPILCDLLRSNTIQRLKKINQSGIAHYVKENAPYTRYDHSVGVFVLLKYYNANLKEQIAGLLHDASHTVFSHVADLVFNHNSNKESYQDSIHEWFLLQTDIPKILQNYKLSLREVLHKNNGYFALEQDLPGLCADRIEYNLKTGVIENIITEKDVEEIIQDLKFNDNNWFFTNKEQAYKFANISLELTEHFWTSANNMLIYKFASEMLLHAIKNNIITSQQFHFSTDDVIWEILNNCNDNKIKLFINKIINHKDSYEIKKDNYDLHCRGKFRGVDPLVKNNNKLIKLSEIDHKYHDKFHSVKKIVSQGNYIKLKN